jgi:hypothetical protein
MATLLTRFQNFMMAEFCYNAFGTPYYRNHETNIEWRRHSIFRSPR